MFYLNKIQDNIIYLLSFNNKTEIKIHYTFPFSNFLFATIIQNNNTTYIHNIYDIPEFFDYPLIHLVKVYHPSNFYQLGPIIFNYKQLKDWDYYKYKIKPLLKSIVYKKKLYAIFICNLLFIQKDISYHISSFL